MNAGGYFGKDASGQEKWGWVSGAELRFFGKNSKIPDYHADGRAALRAFFKDQLLPNVPRGAVIILDHASYHRTRVPGTEIPRPSWNKARIQVYTYAVEAPLPGSTRTMADIAGLYTKADWLEFIDQWRAAHPHEGREVLVVEKLAQDANKENPLHAGRPTTIWTQRRWRGL